MAAMSPKQINECLIEVGSKMDSSIHIIICPLHALIGQLVAILITLCRDISCCQALDLHRAGYKSFPSTPLVPQTKIDWQPCCNQL